MQHCGETKVPQIEVTTQYHTIARNYPQCNFLLFLEEKASAGSCKDMVVKPSKLVHENICFKLK
jgi:hypothetical protein